MFDPEKVERVVANANFSHGDNDGKWYDFDVVEAENYDRLLEIHLHYVSTIIDLFKRCGEPLSAEAIVNLKNGTWR